MAWIERPRQGPLWGPGRFIHRWALPLRYSEPGIKRQIFTTKDISAAAIFPEEPLSNCSAAGNPVSISAGRRRVNRSKL